MTKNKINNANKHKVSKSFNATYKVYENLPLDQKNKYKSLILAAASLSKLYAQKENDNGNNILHPIINSKYQETMFCEAFNASHQDISNTSYDASLTLHGTKVLIGIKTFQNSNKSQKIAQFKAEATSHWGNIVSDITTRDKNGHIQSTK